MKRKYLTIILALLFFCYGGVLVGLAANNNISLEPNSIWQNIKGYFDNIWLKANDIWKSSIKPWLNKLWQEFKQYFKKERIEEEFKKETGEMKDNIIGVGKFILGKANTQVK